MANAFEYRLDKCIATPISTIDSDFFTLLEDGCTTEDWIEAEQHNISFPFFAFYSTNEVYIHCDILLCAPDHPEDCQMPSAETCAENETDGARKRRSIEVNKLSKLFYYYLEWWPISEIECNQSQYRQE